MRAVEDAAVDIWAAQDTGVEDGGAPGQAALWSAGKLRDEVEFGWGGMKMGWTHQQGHKGKQGIKREGAHSWQYRRGGGLRCTRSRLTAAGGGGT